MYHTLIDQTGRPQHLITETPIKEVM